MTSTAVVVYDMEAKMNNDQARLVRKDNITFQPGSANTHISNDNLARTDLE